MKALSASLESRPYPLPGVRLLYNPETRRVKYMRVCDRCPIEREVRDPRAKRNLCQSCVFTLPAPIIARYAA